MSLNDAHKAENGSTTLASRVKYLEDRINTPNFQQWPSHGSRIANTGPLGLFAFGYTTALLSSTYSKWVNDSETGTEEFAYTYGLFFGGLVQLLAGMWAIWARNTFAGTAFSSYGGFWMGYGLHGILVSGGVLTGMEPQGEQTFLALWAIFTFCLLVQTLNISVTIMALFGSLTLAFALLAAGPNHPRVVKAGGYFGQAAAFMAYYIGLAELTNEVYRRRVLPLFILNVVTQQPESEDPRPDTL